MPLGLARDQQSHSNHSERKSQSRCGPERTLTVAEFRLDEEQRAGVRDCLRKANIALSTAVFERLVRDIEDSISRFRGSEPTGGSRNAHDALRAIWLLVHEDDPPLGVLRTRI